MSDETAAPAVTGLGRAVVLLPADAIWWSDTDLNAVLVHELGHAARRDCALNFCGDMAAAFYWCNPLVRRAVRRMRLESERACDDLVLRADVDPGGYAQLLLSLARAAQPAHAFVAAATAIAHRSQLESRLLAVLDARVVRSPVPRRLTAALACAGALVAMPAAALTLAGVDAALQQLPTPEPDTLGDSIAHPSSERVPLDPAAYAIAPEVVNRLAMGPDSMLAAHLVQALAHVASHDGDLVRDRAAWALAQAAPDGRLVDPLLDALGDRDWRIQSYAAWALSIIDESRAVPRLVPLLEHPVWRLRAMAAHAIARSGHAHGRGVMHAALSDPAWQVRLAAVEFFSVTNDPDLENVLRPRLDDRHVAVRGAAARALRKP